MANHSLRKVACAQNGTCDVGLFSAEVCLTPPKRAIQTEYQFEAAVDPSKEEKVSDEKQNLSQPNRADASAPAEKVAAPIQASAEPQGESLDSVEDIDFLLEEIENKIAPLALA